MKRQTRKLYHPRGKKIPKLILSTLGFGTLLDDVRNVFLSTCVLLDPDAAKCGLFARHSAMYVLRMHIGESEAAVCYRFSAAAKEVRFASKRIPRGFRKSYGFQRSIELICARWEKG